MVIYYVHIYTSYIHKNSPYMYTNKSQKKIDLLSSNSWSSYLSLSSDRRCPETVIMHQYSLHRSVPEQATRHQLHGILPTEQRPWLSSLLKTGPALTLRHTQQCWGCSSARELLLYMDESRGLIPRTCACTKHTQNYICICIRYT